MLGPSFPNSRSGSSRRGSALAARVTGSNRRRTRTREPYVPPKSRPAAATAPASVTAGQQRRALAARSAKGFEETLRVRGSGAGPRHPQGDGGGTARVRPAPRPCQRPAGGPARGGALNGPAARRLARAWRSAGPSLCARRHSPLPLAQTTPLRPSRAPPLPRAAIFAARRPRHLLGPPYLPGRRRWRRPSHT